MILMLFKQKFNPNIIKKIETGKTLSNIKFCKRIASTICKVK